MWIVRNLCPFSGQIEEKKIKGKYAYEHAIKFVEYQFNNYQQSIDVWAFEIFKGKLTNRTMSRNKKFNVYDKMLNDHTKRCLNMK